MQCKRKCPVCGSSNHTVLFEHNIEAFDQYSCFRNIRNVCCENCGFVFDNTDYDQNYLNRFYKDESPYVNAMGTGAGGDSAVDIVMYEKYTSIIDSYINKKSCVCEVGCAKGGYLNYLKTKGYENIFGIELSSDLVEKAQSLGLNVQLGTAENIPAPFDGRNYDIIIYNHIFEHLLDFSKVLLSCIRYLSKGSFIFVTVPDAEFYHEYEFFPYYSIINAKEHINHFSEYHFTMLMNGFGFRKIYCAHEILKYNKRNSFPVLLMLFEFTPDVICKVVKCVKYCIMNSMIKYLMQCDIMLGKINKLIDEYIKNQKRLYIWGIGSEFFILSSFTKLFDCNIISLIDKNKEKQMLTYKGIRINPPESLMNTNGDDNILLLSVFNDDAMNQYLSEFQVNCNVIRISDLLGNKNI